MFQQKTCIMHIFCLIFIQMIGGDAHNWLSSPSRANNNFNAYQQAPCPPKGGRVHYQVQAGQKFPVEFATGHSTPARGGTYLTVIKAEDEKHLIKHTRALLDDYIESAPPRSPAYLAEYTSHHVGSSAGSTTGGNVGATLAAAYGVGAQKANIRNYGPNWGNKPARGAAIYKKTAAATNDDRRVQYKSAKYPWIVSAHKFKLHEDKPEEADIVMMEIPEGYPTGQYVVQYSWNGYYDCADVNVISEPSTDLYGAPSATVQFDKLDHCLWNPALPGYRVQGTCKEIKHGEGADSCFSQCTNANGCIGVQVVPWKLPKKVSDMGIKGLFGGKTMPNLCSGLTDLKEDSLVCFTIKEGASIVGPTYYLVDDPNDSVFYGTCYRRGGAWRFAQPGPGTAAVPPQDVFKYGRECVSCNDMKRNQADGIVPYWKLLPEGTCEHCDPTLG
jgi:hypothetical protein